MPGQKWPKERPKNVKNILAGFGYNGDGKRGRMQLVIGLLTSANGTPVVVRVFEASSTNNPTGAISEAHSP